MPPGGIAANGIALERRCRQPDKQTSVLSLTTAGAAVKQRPASRRQSIFQTKTQRV